MRIKIKKIHKDAVIPRYAHFGDAAVDLTAVQKWIDTNNRTCYGTGIAIEIPHNFVGLLFPRSSVAKTDLRLCNSVGVIDSGYRGEIILKFDCGGDNVYSVGDRVGQLMILPLPSIQFFEVENLTDTARDTGGFGSSGN